MCGRRTAVTRAADALDARRTRGAARGRAPCRSAATRGRTARSVMPVGAGARDAEVQALAEEPRARRGRERGQRLGARELRARSSSSVGRQRQAEQREVADAADVADDRGARGSAPARWTVTRSPTAGSAGRGREQREPESFSAHVDGFGGELSVVAWPARTAALRRDRRGAGAVNGSHGHRTCATGERRRCAA